MLVSIIIPCNEDRGFLADTVKAAETQTYPHVEIIVSKSSGSASYNINEGIKKAKGYYIKLCADDDLLTPNCIENSLIAIDGFDFIHGMAINFWSKGGKQYYIPPIKEPTLRDMLLNNIIHGGTVMYRRDCFERFGGFDETLWCGEEYEFNMRLLSKGCKLNYCDSFLQRYRRHKGQKSLGNTGREYQAKRQVEINKIKNRFR
ncbi:hypothetical protein LCGC14_0716390 [marine sediment metagenome]|uniref:Glycosyltransferase 2-like domain-containing protein n=1 Tax=marine sediment metagenome TaxID=412755 RepID=A0A0F9QDL2_9ZZZZ